MKRVDKKLPNKDEINEETMIIQFLKSLDNDTKEKDIEGDSIRKYIESIGKLSEWYDYRENAEYNIAKEWCEKHNIQYLE